MILFQGSGPSGEPHGLNRMGPDGASPLTLDNEQPPGFPSIDRGGKFLALIRRADGQAQLHTVLLTAATLSGRSPIRPEPPALAAKALYYPRVSPSGRRLAVIETPSVGFPSKRGAIGQLAIFNRAGFVWQREPFDRPLSVESFDWGSDDQTLVAVAPSGDLALLRLDRPERAVSLNATGRMPAVSPDGQSIAFVEAGRLMLLDDAGDRALPLPAPVTALCWAADGQSLLVAVTAGFWQSQILRVTPDGTVSAPIHQTANVIWLADLADR